MNAIAGLTPIFAGCGGIAAADGPLPVGDVLALGVATIASLGAIGVAIYQASQTPSISTPKAEEKEKDITIPQQPKRQEIFPVNPLTFNPKGLERKIYVQPDAGKNGGIIKWEIPGTGTAIFEWDQDYKYGSHYHVMPMEANGQHDGIHYTPGMFVPEPWNSLYFGG